MHPPILPNINRNLPIYPLQIWNFNFSPPTAWRFWRASLRFRISSIFLLRRASFSSLVRMSRNNSLCESCSEKSLIIFTEYHIYTFMRAQICFTLLVIIKKNTWFKIKWWGLLKSFFFKQVHFPQIRSLACHSHLFLYSTSFILVLFSGIKCIQ